MERQANPEKKIGAFAQGAFVERQGAFMKLQARRAHEWSDRPCGYDARW